MSMLKMHTITDLISAVTDRNPSWLEKFSLDQITVALVDVRRYLDVRYEDIDAECINDIESLAIDILLEVQ